MHVFLILFMSACAASPIPEEVTSEDAGPACGTYDEPCSITPATSTCCPGLVCRSIQLDAVVLTCRALDAQFE